MSRKPRLRLAIAATLVAVVCPATGCTHNYYYSGAGPCAPMAVGGTAVLAEPSARYGAICDVPGEPSTVVTRTTNGSGVVEVPLSSSSARPKVVTSEPMGSNGRYSSRLGWRKSDPENIANLKVEGAYDETVK